MFFIGIAKAQVRLVKRARSPSVIESFITSKPPAIKVMMDGSNSHFDKKIIDVFLSITCDKILEVLNIDSDTQISNDDRALMEKFSLLDLYRIKTGKEESPQSYALVDTFEKYYYNTLIA